MCYFENEANFIQESEGRSGIKTFLVKYQLT